MLMSRCERDTDGHEREQQQLPASSKAERTTVRHLDEVVQEADGPTAERDEQNRQGRHLVLANREERDCRDDEDEQPTHRRCSLLAAMRFRPLLADVLAELVLAQERNEARP